MKEGAMLAKDPLDLSKICPENIDREIIRYRVESGREEVEELTGS